MIKIFREFWAMSSKFKILSYFFLGIAAAICDFLFVNAVSNVVARISSNSYTILSRDYITVFLVIIFLIVWTRKVSSVIVINISQRLLWNYRKRVLAMVLKANYEQFSKKKMKILSSMTGDAQTLTNVSISAVPFLSSLIMSIACLIYLATISVKLFFVTFITALSGCLIYYYGSVKSRGYFKTARHLENDFFRDFVSIMDGFKEIFMNPQIGKSIYETRIKGISNTSYKSNVSAFVNFLNNQIVGQILFYLLLTFILLYFSVVLNIQSSNIIRFVFVLMYLFSSVQAVMVLLPGFMNAKVASEHLTGLQKELNQLEFDDNTPQHMLKKADYYKIAVNGLEYQYGEDGGAFKIGPIEFNIESGEVVFIYGGNGCGKTTFINTLLGLLTPAEGELKFNDQPVTKYNKSQYRSFFSVVFSDFFLFDEVHGVEKVNVEKWKKYVELFELEGKVNLIGKKYSMTALSTGQRKRLALITALLAEKPILVMDEWAADQDPTFKNKFYTEIIPFLRKEKMAVLAITHDDRYYHCADRLYKMESGKLVEKVINVPA